jgi:hypothetical protein
MSLKIADSIYPKTLSQRSRKDLNSRLLPKMETVTTSLKTGFKLEIHRIDMFTNPGADSNAAI